MKTRLRLPSGAKIRLHGKRDNRLSGLKKGTLWHKDTRITYRDGDRYVTGVIERILADDRGVSSKNLRWITRKCLLRVQCAGQVASVRVLTRTDDHLTGVKV